MMVMVVSVVVVMVVLVIRMLMRIVMTLMMMKENLVNNDGIAIGIGTLSWLIENLCLKGENPTRSCGSRWKGCAKKWWSWWS